MLSLLPILDLALNGTLWAPPLEDLTILYNLAMPRQTDENLKSLSRSHIAKLQVCEGGLRAANPTDDALARR